MSGISVDQLLDLTERVNSLFAEFGQGDLRIFDSLSLGQMRLICKEVDKWQREQHERSLEQYADESQWVYNRGFEAGRASALHKD